MIVTQTFLLELIKTLTFKDIKQLISRQRLKFSYDEISFYCYCVFVHQLQQHSFISLHKKLSPSVKYSTFMHNINLFSPLVESLFLITNKNFSIKPSELLNIVDTTLIEEKQAKYITQKDWDSGRVVSRTKKQEKVHTCGSKGLVFLNKFNQIYYADLLNIKFSDQNILKSCYNFMSKLKGILLADRGLSNMAVRQRLTANKNNIFDYERQVCRLISPYHYKQSLKLTAKEWKLYKLRQENRNFIQDIEI